MKSKLGIISIVFGLIACLLVFVDAFKTPPLLITLSGVLGLITGAIGLKEQKGAAMVGLILSLVSLGYLIYLFAALGS